MPEPQPAAEAEAEAEAEAAKAKAEADAQAQAEAEAEAAKARAKAEAEAEAEAARAKAEADAQAQAEAEAEAAKAKAEAEAEAEAARAKAEADAQAQAEAEAEAAKAKADADAQAQAEAEAEAEAAKAKADADAGSSRNRAQSVEPTYGPWQQEVWKSFVDSRVRSRSSWDTHGVNLIPALWALLKDRLKADRKSTGRTELAIGHYIDAALRTAPLNQKKLVELTDGIQSELEGLPKGKKTTLGLSREAIKNFNEILDLLDSADYSRKGKDAVCALVLQLLRNLKEEGPLPKSASASKPLI